jgi:hypothetical protein
MSIPGSSVSGCFSGCLLGHIGYVLIDSQQFENCKYLIELRLSADCSERPGTVQRAPGFFEPCRKRQLSAARDCVAEHFTQPENAFAGFRCQARQAYLIMHGFPDGHFGIVTNQQLELDPLQTAPRRTQLCEPGKTVTKMRQRASEANQVLREL